METRVQKWGHSLALRIPKPFTAELGLEQNSAVNIVVADGKIVIAPVKKTVYLLERLLEQVNEENLHNEFNFGEAAGKEAW